ncbi:hypothetical protein IWW38_006120, partial [Coemansia aciculifera]
NKRAELVSAFVELLAAFEFDPLPASTHSGLLLAPERPIRTPQNTRPSMKEIDDDAPSLKFVHNSWFFEGARRLQTRYVRENTDATVETVTLGNEGNLGERPNPYYCRNEDVAVDHMRAVISPRVQRFLSRLKPNATYRYIDGIPTKHADAFMLVTATNSAGVRVCGSMAIEAKKPYSADKQPHSVSAKTPRWVRLSGMHSESFGKKLLYQVRKYAGEGSRTAPEEVQGTISPDFVVVTDVNSAWVAKFETESGDLRRTEASPPDNPPARSQTRARVLTQNNATVVSVSNRFDIESNDPHFAFAFVYPLIQLINDMESSTSGYALAP